MCEWDIWNLELLANDGWGLLREAVFKVESKLCSKLLGAFMEVLHALPACQWARPATG